MNKKEKSVIREWMEDNEVSGTIEDIVKKALRERWQDGST